MLQGVTAGLLLLLLLVVVVVVAVAVPSEAFVSSAQQPASAAPAFHRYHTRHQYHPHPPTTSGTTATATTANIARTTRHRLYALPPDYQVQGNQLIRKAATLVGVKELEIEWKPGRVVCTVLGDDVYLSAPLEDGLADEDDDFSNNFFLEGQDDNGNGDELFDYDDDDGGGGEEVMKAATPASTDKAADNDSNGRIDVAVLARAINTVLDDEGEGGIGWKIAETHEIQVTTAGASDALRGDVMFRAYRGFDVIVQHQDPKQRDDSKKIKTAQGRLVERNDEFTVINIKGRVKNFKNTNIISVTLPKAKKEKGAR